MMLHPDDVLIHRIQSRELFLQYHLHVVKTHLLAIMLGNYVPASLFFMSFNAKNKRRQ